MIRGPCAVAGLALVAAVDGSDEKMFTDLSQDAWLMGWCLAGPWLDEAGKG